MRRSSLLGLLLLVPLPTAIACSEGEAPRAQAAGGGGNTDGGNDGSGGSGGSGAGGSSGAAGSGGSAGQTDGGADADAGPATCAGDPCGAHGSCTEGEGGITCTCSDHYSGPTCSVCDPREGCGVAHVLYLGDVVTDGVNELFYAPVAGGVAPTKVNGTLTAGGSVTAPYAASPDGKHIVYRADQDTDEVYELYAATVGAAGTIKLSGPMVAGGGVPFAFPLRWSAGGSHVLYMADQETVGVREIYSVPVTGGTPKKLNGALAAGRSIQSWDVTLDRARVVYVADQDTDEVYELYSVPVDGSSAPVKLNGALAAGGDVEVSYSVSGGASVVYRADADVDGVGELYSVPVLGGAPPVKLNAALGSGERVYNSWLTPDRDTVVFNTGANLFAAPAVGGAPAWPLDAVTPCTTVRGLAISVDGATVAYVDQADELRSVPTAGGTSVKLSGSAPVGGKVNGNSVVILPDGSRALYVADHGTLGVDELYSAPIGTAGAALRLSPALDGSRDVKPLLLPTSDSSRVVYVGNVLDPLQLEVLSAPVASAAPATRVNGGFVANGNLVSEYAVRLTLDGASVVYLADAEVDDRVELYVAPVVGGTPAVRLSQDLGPGQNVISTSEVVYFLP